MTDQQKLEQRANDMLHLLAVQRNQAQDLVVQVTADLEQTRRELAAAKQEIAALMEPPKPKATAKVKLGKEGI